jgi:hypothetical protein
VAVFLVRVPPNSDASHKVHEEYREVVLSACRPMPPRHPLHTIPPKTLERRLLPYPLASVGINIHSLCMYNVAILATTAEQHFPHFFP